MESHGSSGGIGFCGLLTIVFIVLKILGKITWSWWWVVSPIWIPVAVFVAVLAIVGIAAGLTAAVRRLLDVI